MDSSHYHAWPVHPDGYVYYGSGYGSFVSYSYGHLFDRLFQNSINLLVVKIAGTNSLYGCIKYGSNWLL